VTQAPPNALMEFLSKFFSKLKNVSSKKGTSDSEDERPEEKIPGLKGRYTQVTNTSYACDACRVRIPMNEFRYHCTECSDFDFCTKCFGTLTHEHRMSAEIGNPNLVGLHIREAKNLWKAFSYATLPLYLVDLTERIAWFLQGSLQSL